jgi:hypothetical protein
MNDNLAYQVDLFAELMVRLDDPFEERSVVLATEGLDEDQASSLVASWRLRFDRDATGGLVASFADAYAGRRAAREAQRRSGTYGGAPADRDGGHAGPRFLNDDAQSFRDEAAKVAVSAEEASPPPRPAAAPMPPQQRAFEQPTFATAKTASAPADATADITALVPRHTLPFTAAGPGALAAPLGSPKPVPQPSPSEPRTTVDLTAQVALVQAAMPFAIPPAAVPPSPPPAARRLIRFDPQTGQPLPVPIWVDVPADPKGTTR